VAGNGGRQLQVQRHHTRVPSSELTRPLPDVVKQFDQAVTTHITIAGMLIGFYTGAIFEEKVITAAVFDAVDCSQRDAYTKPESI
jgi:hypothetical protein